MKKLIILSGLILIINSCGAPPPPAEYPMAIGTQVDYEVTTITPGTLAGSFSVVQYYNATQSLITWSLPAGTLTWSYSFNTTVVDQKLMFNLTALGGAIIKGVIKINGTVYKEATSNSGILLLVNGWL